MSNPEEVEAASADAKMNGDAKPKEDLTNDAAKDEPMTDSKPSAAAQEEPEKKEGVAAALKTDDVKKPTPEPSEEDFADEDDVAKEEEELFCTLEQEKAKEELEHAGDEKVAPTLLKEALQKGEVVKSPDVKDKKEDAGGKPGGEAVSGIPRNRRWIQVALRISIGSTTVSRGSRKGNHGAICLFLSGFALVTLKPKG